MLPNKDIIGAILAIILGLWFLTRNKPLAQKAIDYRQQSKYFKMEVTERTEKNFRLTFLGAGILLILMGLSSLFGIW
jgi:hypothetical protein